MTILDKKSITQLRAEIEKLRRDYAQWKSDHLNQQNEQIINKFLLLKAEMKKRKKVLTFKQTFLDQEAAMFQRVAEIRTIPVFPTNHTFTEKKYAPVAPSGTINGDLIRLRETEPYFKNFAVSSPVAWVVGGIVIHPEGTKNDIDILLSIPTEEELKRIIEFRLGRMLPEKIQSRLHLLTEEKGGMSPFTDYIGLYRLIMERIPDAEIVKMEELDLGAEIRLRNKGVEKQKKEAKKALKLDKITPGEFWLMMKCVRGYYPGEAQTLKLFLDIYDEHYEFPSLSSKKYNGEHLLISKLEDDIIIHSEDGKILEKLPNLKNEVKTLKPKVCVLEAELEKWNYSTGQYYPRETVHTGVTEDNYTANVFDILYYKGEIPEDLFEEIGIFDKDKEEWKRKYL
jgi:hypothetical protein